ncbi:MAG: M55 family metallopeptidase [Alicyclobacillus sp.]|nr:M55 family metallopeptidase [Alicyclobacillus sp.]
MRVYISADGEGATALVGSAEMVPGGSEYEFGRRMMTADVNAAVAGAFDAGATYVLVNDTHWSERSLLPSELDPRAELLRGSGKPLSMMEGIDTGFDAALFVGYHGRAGGSRGVANETILGREIYDVRVNGTSVGELELNAAVAHHFGVPVVFVSGDDQLAREVAAALPDTEVAVVKYAVERWSARCLHPEVAHARIRDGVAAGLTRLWQGQTFRGVSFDPPLVCEVEFTSTAHAGAASLMPGANRLGARTVSYTARDPVEAWRAVFSLMLLGSRHSDAVYG